MRHLAVRFVRPSGALRIASADGPSTSLSANIHVVDPNLDMRDRFLGEKGWFFALLKFLNYIFLHSAIRLSQSILARKLTRSIDLLETRNEYEQW